MRLMFSFPFLEVYVRFAAVNAMLWLAADVEAQTASKTGPIKPDPGLVADYWVHLSIVAILLLFFAGLSVFALTKFYKAMSDQTNGGLWLETHWGGLGGGLGGWRVSNAFVYLIVVAVLSGLAVATISLAPTYPRVTPDNSQKDSPPQHS